MLVVLGGKKNGYTQESILNEMIEMYFEKYEGLLDRLEAYRRLTNG